MILDILALVILVILSGLVLLLLLSWAAEDPDGCGAAFIVLALVMAFLWAIYRLGG